VVFAAFNARGDRLATFGRDGKAFLWDLAPEGRETAELVRFGQLMNSRRIDSSGGALPVDPATQEGLWREVRKGAAAPLDTPVETTAAWHEGEAAECEASQRWFAAVFHLRRLLELNPSNPEVIGRIAAAQSALDKEQQDRAKRFASLNQQKAVEP
jgi:hypothetical protein